MTIFYLDLINGNDSNDGTTYANRWKSFSSGATAARISPGDTIRIMKSPDPASIGNATWTSGLNYITLSDTTLTKTIDNCDNAWTASANVTATANTTYYREGTGSASLVIASGFTTGLVAYKATGTLDLSSYQQVSFWIRSSSTVVTTAGYLTLTLCSDVSGATPVNTISVPAVPVADLWQVVTVDTGGALGSSIKSVALNSTYDFGATTIYLDNIIACKDDSLTLSSLISKNTTDECWYPILSINGTNNTIVKLDNSAGATVPSAAREYGGTFETTTTYIREGIKSISSALTYATNNTLLMDVQDSGLDCFHIIFSGGWDMTDMSTQDGDTFVDGQNCGAIGLRTNSKSFIKFEKIHLARFSTGLTTISTGTGIIVSGNMYICGCTSGNLSIATSGNLIDNIYTWGSATSITLSGGHNTTIKRMVASGASTNGLYVSATYNVSIVDYGEIKSNKQRGIIFTSGANNNMLNNIVFKGNSYGIVISDSSGDYLNNCTQNNIVYNGTFDNTSNWTVNSGWAIADGVATATSSNSTLVRNENPTIISSVIYRVEYTISSYTSGTITASIGGVSGTTRSSTGTFSEIITTTNTSQLTFTASSATLSIDDVKTIPIDVSFSTTLADSNVFFHKYNQTANSHYIHGDGYIVSSETGSDRHTSSGIAWKITTYNSTRSSSYPIKFLIAKINCTTANATKTLSAYIRRYTGTITPVVQLLIKGKQIEGVNTDIITTATGSEDVYQQETITVTPTGTGIIDVYLKAYGAGTFSVYIDDITIS